MVRAKCHMLIIIIYMYFVVQMPEFAVARCDANAFFSCGSDQYNSSALVFAVLIFMIMASTSGHIHKSQNLKYCQIYKQNVDIEIISNWSLQ